jgi:hypothetical protein
MTNTKIKAKNLFNKIVDAIPTNIFKHKESINEAAIDIYLTACGIRPACIPFDGEVRYNGIGSNEMYDRIIKNNKSLIKLQQIKEITVVIGPYYDTGDAIVVCNTEQMKSTQKHLNTIYNIRKNDNNPADNPLLHISMGKLLGYLCPSNMSDLYKNKKLYSIEFHVDNRSHMEVWCPIQKKNIADALNKLEEMNTALQLIDKQATLNISYQYF